LFASLNCGLLLRERYGCDLLHSDYYKRAFETFAVRKGTIFFAYMQALPPFATKITFFEAEQAFPNNWREFCGTSIVGSIAPRYRNATVPLKDIINSNN